VCLACCAAFALLRLHRLRVLHGDVEWRNFIFHRDHGPDSPEPQLMAVDLGRAVVVQEPDDASREYFNGEMKTLLRMVVDQHDVRDTVCTIPEHVRRGEFNEDEYVIDIVAEEEAKMHRRLAGASHGGSGAAPGDTMAAAVVDEVGGDAAAAGEAEVKRSAVHAAADAPLSVAVECGDVAGAQHAASHRGGSMSVDGVSVDASREGDHAHEVSRACTLIVYRCC
jgi:hypothetical protein